MGYHIPALAALLFASIACASDLPDTSERFREAMSACTLAGPGLEARLARLSQTGWTEGPTTPEDAAAFRDAGLLDAAPEATREAWSAARAAAAPDLPDTVHRNGAARLIVAADPATGAPTCHLATLNSADSDGILTDIAAAGAVTEVGPVRQAALATTLFDAGQITWRTEITLSSADTPAANALLADPLAATLSVTFVTRPKE